MHDEHTDAEQHRPTTRPTRLRAASVVLAGLTAIGGGFTAYTHPSGAIWCGVAGVLIAPWCVVFGAWLQQSATS